MVADLVRACRSSSRRTALWEQVAGSRAPRRRHEVDRAAPLPLAGQADAARLASRGGEVRPPSCGAASVVAQQHHPIAHGDDPRLGVGLAHGCDAASWLSGVEGRPEHGCDGSRDDGLVPGPGGWLRERGGCIRRAHARHRL
eukprot:4735444-Prymnesium_polylepis.1